MTLEIRNQRTIGLPMVAGIVGEMAQDEDEVRKFENILDERILGVGEHPQQVSLGLASFFRSGMARDNSERFLTKSSEVCVVFNGLLFNGEELRKEILGDDKANTLGPGQLLICLYNRFGISALRSLVGEFSLALWDEKKRLLFLGVDFLATRPLFYRRLSHGSIAFSSTIRHLKRPNDIPNKAHIFERIGTSFSGPVPTRSTSISGINRVSPGMCVEVSVDTGYAKIKRSRYWHLGELENVRYRNQSEYADELRFLIMESLECNLRATDNLVSKVGVAFTGGVDSSSILCMLQMMSGSVDVESLALTVRFSEPTGDEPYQQAVFDNTRVKNRLIFPNEADFLDYSDAMEVYDFDEPLHSLMCSCLLLELLAKSASELNASLLFTGLGGDGLFNGNPYWISDSIRRGEFIKVARGIRDWSRTENESLRVSGGEFLGRALRKSHSSFIGMANSSIFNKKELGLQWDEISSDFLELNQDAPLSRCLTYYHMLLDVCSYSRNHHFFERHGVRESNPFFYQPLVEYMLGIPGDMNYEVGTTGQIVRKRLLRESMKGIVPIEVLERRTKGSAGNVATKQMMDARHRIEELILGGDSRLVDLGIICPSTIRDNVECWHMSLDVFRWSFPIIAMELWLRNNF